MRQSIIKKLDMFGQSVQLTFRQREKYKTDVGGIASIFLFMLLGFLIAIKTVEYADKENAQMYMANTIGSVESIDLFKLNYRFAIMPVDPRIGTFEAFQHFTEPNIRHGPSIPLINCRDIVLDEGWSRFLTDPAIQVM